MKKLFLSILFIPALFACQGNESKYYYDNTNQMYIIDGNTQVLIKSGSVTNFDTFYFPFIQDCLKNFSRFSKPDNAALILELNLTNTSLYDLLFILGGKYFSDYQNQALVVGMLQDRWATILMEHNNFPDEIASYLDQEWYNIIMIKDFKDLLSSEKVTRKDVEEIYKYLNLYLLDQVYFVSLQEVMERPYRYFHPEFFRSYFSQIVILPELRFFYSYINKKYSRNRIKNLMKQKYGVEEWEKNTGEQIHEVEDGFRKSIETQKFTFLDDNQSFKVKLDALLKLYNTTTKSTLFKD